MSAPANVRLLLIDNYDSFTYNLVQAFMILGAEVDVRRNDEITVEQAQAARAHAPVHFAGTGHAIRRGRVSMDMIRAFAGQVPVFGVCLGHQSIVEVFGGKVVRAPRLMHGKTSPVTHDGKGLFAGLPQSAEVGRYHSLIAKAETLPADLEVTAQHAGRRDHGRAPPAAQSRRRAVPSRERAHARRPAAHRQLPEDDGRPAMSLRDTLEHLLSGKSLTEAEAGDLLRALTGAEMPPRAGGRIAGRAAFARA